METKQRITAIDSMDEKRSSKAKFAIAIIISIVLLTLVFGVGMIVGFKRRPAIEKMANVLSKETDKPAAVDFSVFWEVWAKLQEKYVDKDKTDPQKQTWGAVSGMVKSLGDPYTVFLPPAETKQFQEDLKGEFGGIGTELGMRKGVITVITPLKGSPAERAGIKAGDKIIKVDDTVTADFTLEQIVQLIRGEKGKPVRITILRDSLEEPKEFTIIRETIVIPTIETKTLSDGIFYIHLFNFNESSTREFRNAVKEFMNTGSGRLALDLRGNPGGFLHAAVDIASWFLPAGEIVARERFADGSEDEYRSSGRRILEKIPVVVLINQGSASASEILAGALRDKRKIKLVGEKSFGKGSVQELVNFDKGASLKVTIAKWLTPSGHTLEGEGLEPDIKVEIKKEDTDEGRDPQLDKALETLKGMQ